MIGPPALLFGGGRLNPRLTKILPKECLYPYMQTHYEVLYNTKYLYTHTLYLSPVTRFVSRHPFCLAHRAIAWYTSAFTVVTYGIIMASTLSPPPSRPQTNNRHPTAPSVMTVNGHFASANEKPTAEHYEHGMQVINEDQEFKYVFKWATDNCPWGKLPTDDPHSKARISHPISPSKRSRKLASTTTLSPSLARNLRASQPY